MIVGSMYEKAPDGRYVNSAPFIGRDGAILGAYRKTHVCSSGGRACTG